MVRFADRAAAGALALTLLTALLAGTPRQPASASPSGVLTPPGPTVPSSRSPKAPLAPGDLAGSPGEELSAQLGRILDGARWRSSRWSVLAVSLDRGDTLFSRNPRTPLAPASNLKLLTSVAALHYLGPDFRFQTFVLSDGTVDATGTLQGDVILYGTGDPAISDRLYPSATTVLDELARELARRGIRRVQGDIVGDGTFFPDGIRPPGWRTGYLNDWFAAPVSALSYNENVATIRVEPGAFPGADPVVHTIPEGAPLHIVNQATTVGGRAWPPLMTDRPDPSQPTRLVGQMRVGGREAWRVLTVGDPALFAADALRTALDRAGISVTGETRSLTAASEIGSSRLTGRRVWAPGIRSEPRIRILARHRSPPLTQLLEVLNKQSHNLYAELLLKTVGQVALADPTRAGGISAVTRYLREGVGVDPALFHIEDGSGLSPDNRVSAEVFVQVLAYAAREVWADALWASLPEAGNRRELPRMFRTAAARNLRAKTGTIEHVSALSGVVRNRRGERILFSIISNDVSSTSAAKRIEDRIGAQLAAFDRPFQTPTSSASAEPAPAARR